MLDFVGIDRWSPTLVYSITSHCDPYAQLLYTSKIEDKK